MWSVKPEMNMQSPKPAITKSCNDKNWQSTRCNKKKNCDKNCQSYVKSESEGTMLFSYVASNENKWYVVSTKTDCKWIGTQPEVARNIYSTSKCWYPSINCIKSCFHITDEDAIYPYMTREKTESYKQIRDTKTQTWTLSVLCLFHLGIIWINKRILQCMHKTTS